MILLLLDERENVEPVNRPVRKEAVDGVLFIQKSFEDAFQFHQHEQLHMNMGGLQ